MHLFGSGTHRVAFCIVLGCGLLVSSAMADLMILTPSKDVTLYSYDHGLYDPTLPSTHPKADGASHLHVGDTNNNNGLQRGLIQFDLSGIPSSAMVTDVSLTLVVADVPSRVLQRDINFWIVAMQGLSQPWSQGPGSEQSPAVPGDATWFHTEYDPALHGQLGNTSGNEFRGFAAGNPGYWPSMGYFGNDDLLETAPNAGVGGLFDDNHALVLGNDEHDRASVGDVVNWSNARMISDVQSWVAGTKVNFGWIMIGEEWINASHTVVVSNKVKPASSKIDFFSSETADIANNNFPPTLMVTYSAVPEPGTLVIMLLGLAVLLFRRVR